jgi:N-acetylglucosamine-6-phosphate deacetylase
MINPPDLLFTNARIIGASHPINNGWLLTSRNLIHSFSEGKPTLCENPENVEIIDCGGLTLLPGFIDLHTHGALGADFVFGSREKINQITTFYASHGVTGFLASTYAASPEEISNAISTIHSCQGSETGAQILGVHLEGPWLDPTRAGAQDRSKLRCADPKEAMPYLESGLIRLIALAPEITENQWLINTCRQKGITVSAGHTSATYDQMALAVQMGVTQVTHCFNAMSGLHHREPGVVGAALTMPELRCELIADNIHVHPAVIQLLINAKSPQGVILITDSVSAAGMPDGLYSLEGQTVTLANGSARLADGTLAGSTLTMDAALRNLIGATGRPIEEVWRCVSLNAAEAIHIADHKGKIEAGCDADLVVLDSNLHVKLTISEGKILFDDR